ncbi:MULTISPECIES: hypothetical protein [unclassified Pseudomonas]|uniref:hypothetical protein n=1 Tax=unclassified Pseudomonas TaxID=196821 RepID=UPI001CBF3EB9|nr:MULTISPECIES: hypothetical protein [unclassified Pseudomonas]
MTKYFPLLLSLLLLACSKAASREIVSGQTPRSIILRDSNSEVIYKNIVGDKEGFDRKLITINDSPALRASARYKFYYTLTPKENEILIDCAYFDVRNIYNGARVSTAICGLNTQLTENYDEIAQDYSNTWRESFFSFDTKEIFETGIGKDFFLGKIGEIEIFDRYPSANSLENSAPQKIIKSRSGCFNFADAVGFLVFINKDKPTLHYLDVLRSEDPVRLQRIQEQDLKK